MKVEMKSERIIELIVWVLILLGGLTTAYVSFGILKSEASGQLAKYSLSGAIVGAIVSWGVLTTVYLQLRGSSKELEDLRERTEELQHKLIRGAPKPEGFATEVDERQRIVLARPEGWEPKGGTIFDLELDPEKMKAGDSFASAFRCYFGPIEKSTPPRADFYDNEIERLKNDTYYVHSYTTEMVHIGGEKSEIESLKVFIRQFVRIEIKRSRETRQIERSWWVISKDEFTGSLYSIEPKQVYLGKPIQVKLRGYELRQGGICHVGNRKADTHVDEDNTARVTLTNEDVIFPGPIEITWENPEARGLRSNHLILIVSEEVGSEELVTAGLSPQSIEEPHPAENADTKTSTPIAEKSNSDGIQVVYDEVVRMRVLCYNEPLNRIYVFDFLDDAHDFNESSVVFNRVLNSIRFLD